MPLHRSRSGRAIPPGTEGPLREPFSAGPFRQRTTSSPSTTPARKGRQYGENQPPENVNLAKGNNLEGASPALLKSASKKAKGHLVSPALPPMPPSAKASPAQVWQQPTSATLLDTSAKRKLNWEAQAASASEFASGLDRTAAVTPVTEANVDDNGVKVIVRVRPLTHREQQEGEIETLCVSSQTISLSQQMFTFDAVAGSDATQSDLFNMVGIPMVNHCISGFNSSIFAYGQTGSGKTYTMWGPTQDNSNVSLNQSRGIAPRLFEHLFSRIEEEERRHSASQLRYQCRCSFLEIYNEQITDLLEPSQKNLQIREDTRTGVYVENLTEEFVSGVNDITELLLKGLANRSVGSTMMNNESSRSHSVFTCIIECRCKSLEHGVSSLRSSRMNLVDLAGSERQKLTGAAGERLKEAGNINRSLSQLGNVINILAEVAQSGKQRHIPYRDSRLTFLLQESLGGNAKLAMICSISTANSCKSETLSTLRFAKRAKAIQNKAVVNEETENDVNLLREQIRQLKEELLRMKSSSAERPSGWNPRRSYNLLRMSLNYPLALPKGDLESDSDEEMEIEDATPSDPRVQEGGSSNDVIHVQCSELGSSKDVLDANQMMRLEDDVVEVPACPEVLCEGQVSATEVHTADSLVVEDMMQLDDDDEDVEVPAFQEVASEVVGTAGAAIELETADSLLVEEMMQLEEDDAEGPACPEAVCKCPEIAGAHAEVETASALVVEQIMQLEDDDALRPARPEAMHERLGSAGAAIPQELIELETVSGEAPVSEGHESAEVALSEDDAATDQVWKELGRSGHGLVSEQMVDLKDDPSDVTASEKVARKGPEIAEDAHVEEEGCDGLVVQHMIQMEDGDPEEPACQEALCEGSECASAANTTEAAYGSIVEQMVNLEGDDAEDAHGEEEGPNGLVVQHMIQMEDADPEEPACQEAFCEGSECASAAYTTEAACGSIVEQMVNLVGDDAEDAHGEEERPNGLVVGHMIKMEDADPEEPACQEALCEGSEYASVANATEAAYGSIVEQMVNLEGDDAEDAHGEEEGPNGLVVQHMIQMEDADPEEPACQEALCEGSEYASVAYATEAAYGSIVEQMVNLEGDDAEDAHGEEEGPNGLVVQHMIQMEDADPEEPACQEALCEGSEYASAANATEAAYGSIVEQMRNLEGDDAVVDGGAAIELEAACAKAPVIEVQETAKTVLPEDYAATGQVFPELGRPTNGLVVENLLQLKDEFADVSVSQTTAVPEVAGAHVEEESASGLVPEQIVKMEDGIPEVPECREAFFEGADCASAAHHGFEAAYGPVVGQMLNLEGNDALGAVCQDALCKGPTIAGASIPQHVIAIETICIESQATEGQEISKVTLSEHFEQEQGIVATSAVCPDPGKLVDGSIVKEMHLEDDAVVAAACPVSGRHETAQLTILEQVVQNQDDSGSVCSEIGGAHLELDRGGVSNMDDDSAQSLVHQELGSADCAIRDQTTSVDVGSPFLDESPRRLPCHTDCAGVWSYKVAESQPYYDCMSVFGSCTRFSSDSVREMVPSSPPGPRPEHLPDVNEDSLPVTPTTEQLRTVNAVEDGAQVSVAPNECYEMLPVTEDSTAKKATEESPAKDDTAVFGEPSVESDLSSVVVQAAPTRIVMPASPSGNGKRSHEVVACGESTAVPTLEPSYNQTRPKSQLTKAVEALLAGAIRREEAAEEKVRKQAAEIEQLNRLVRQYKHERECNAILQQSREDKIARLESLMDGVLPSDAFLTHEWAALTNEHQILLDKYDNHPEVTHSLIQQQRVLEELREYRDFFDLGEKEEMQKEIRQLRKKLQDFLESGPPARPLDSRRRSMLMQSISVRQSMSVRHSVCLRGSVADRSALALCPDPKRIEENSDTLCDDLSMVVSDLFYPESKKARLQEEQAVEEAGFDGSLSPVGESSIVATECLLSRDKEWEERENDWIAVLEEIRLEADSYRRQAEMRTHELECERRCSEEAREALQMAVAGHARLLEQYAELQEKHISVLAKHRKIREGASDVKKMAKRAGISQLDSRWLETQATKMAVMEADHEEERQSMRHEIESLRAQLNDTADAVQAAGELLVRLKESEEAVSIAQDAALLAEQDAVALQRELEKAKRKHATEIAVLQQRVLESRLQKSTLCQMCAMAERVKFEFTEVHEETAQADMEAEREAAALNVDRLVGTCQESIEEEHWVLSPIRYAQNADDWDYQSPVRDHDPAAQSRYDYYIDDYEKGWRR